MAQQLGKGLARDWKLEVNTGDSTTPVWTLIKGLRSVQLTIDGAEADTSDFDSGVWGGKIIVGRDWSIECEGVVAFTLATVAPFDRVYDPGQEFLKGKALEAGWDAQAEIRYTRRDSGTGYSGWANVSIPTSGGGTRDLDPFNLTLSGDGELTPVTGP